MFLTSDHTPINNNNNSDTDVIVEKIDLDNVASSPILEMDDDTFNMIFEEDLQQQHHSTTSNNSSEVIKQPQNTNSTTIDDVFLSEDLQSKSKLPPLTNKKDIPSLTHLPNCNIQESKKRKSIPTTTFINYDFINYDFSKTKKLKTTGATPTLGESNTIQLPIVETAVETLVEESIELSTLGESNSIQSPIVETAVESIQLPIVESNTIQLIPCSNPEDMYDYSINPQKIHGNLYINVSSPCEFIAHIYWSTSIQANPKELGKISLLFEQEGIHSATELNKLFYSELEKKEKTKMSKILFHIKIDSILFHLHTKPKIQLPSLLVLNVNNQSASLQLPPKCNNGERGNYQSGNFHAIKFKSAQ